VEGIVTTIAMMQDPSGGSDVPSAHPAESFRLLTRGDVRQALAHVDPVAAVEATLRAHAGGRTVLPAEAYLSWRNSQGASCRSLAMPGGLLDSEPPMVGVKIINAAMSNPAVGIPRAGGFIVAFDYESGRPSLVAEGALISALRTASYTMASLRRLGPKHFERIAILGCGNLAHVHVELIERYFPSVTHLDLHDTRALAADALSARWTAQAGRTATVHASPRAAVAEAPVLITLTTSDEPYIHSSWLPAEVFVAHVSLDDLAADVFQGAEVFVDDIGLVRDNPRRILGRLLAEGKVMEHPGADQPGLRGTLGQVLTGEAPVSRPDGRRIISNPFGMSVLDLALLRIVQAAAAERGLGVLIDLSQELPARTIFRAAEEAVP
jgi:N-[(2S)-2-amino-2-carboxyethyl]-L-glutamate dehydrogenase